ncbi:hypothetical protein IFM89_006849 [Coptis chinensis]|uniref:J domain-containing protein n=1 Tax=Coptis chinensis TaxID=261450 RepID=A0A835LV64_9MAGN|nr:hypothetical protein IFM89_006849 [Coptis chinensis]
MGRKNKCRDTSSSSSESDTDTSSSDTKSRRHNRSRDDKYTRRRRSKGSRRDKRRKKRDPETVLGYILGKFPDVVHDLKQAVDTTGISDRYFVKQLRKLFVSLNLKESDDGIFLLPPKCRPTLELVGPMMSLHERLRDPKLPHSGSNIEPMKTTDDPAPRRRVIGPEMPSSELLAAAAKLTEATAELRDAEFEFDNDLFIGPAPPAVAAEAASSNEAERFEEVTRIMEVETGSPYDLLGVNRNMSADNIKKRKFQGMIFLLKCFSCYLLSRYWKLSLMVHPDKCSHPQAHQAFVKLNEGFKELQDPDKRKAMDDKIRLKEEQEEFKAELKVMREAAQWRRLQEQDLGVVRIPISKTFFGLNWCGFARKSEALCVPERIGVKFGLLLYSGCGTSGLGSRTWLRSGGGKKEGTISGVVDFLLIFFLFSRELKLHAFAGEKMMAFVDDRNTYKALLNMKVIQYDGEEEWTRTDYVRERQHGSGVGGRGWGVI